ncbi:MAG: hypothetical protein AABX23_01665 [Nanoarchaeota archaeon]
MNESKEEYFVLSERLEIVRWAISGDCDDIDCDRYLYKDLLRKKYKPVLEHNFSCINKLKREEKALLRILSDKRYKKSRYETCQVCKNYADKLDEKNEIVCFAKELGDRKGSEIKTFFVHKRCYKKVKSPKGWNKLI